MADDYTLDTQLDPDETAASRFDRALSQRQQRHGRYVQSGTNLLRARGQLIQEEVAQQRFEMQHQELDLKRVLALAAIVKQRTAIQQQMQQQQHTVQALSELGKLDSSSPDYHTKLAEVFQSNPLASRDPLVQDLVKSQITSRHVMEQSAAAIQQHEEAQASEFARIHGVNPKRDEETGRIDWTASQKLADDAAKTRRTSALTDADATLPLTKVVDSDGKITETREIPAATIARQSKIAGEIAESKSKLDKTQSYIDNEQKNLAAATDQKAKDDFQKKITTLTIAKQGHQDNIDALTAEHAALAPNAPPQPAPVVKLDPATGKFVPVQ